VSRNTEPFLDSTKTMNKHKASRWPLVPCCSFNIALSTNFNFYVLWMRHNLTLGNLCHLSLKLTVPPERLFLIFSFFLRMAVWLGTIRFHCSASIACSRTILLDQRSTPWPWPSQTRGRTPISTRARSQREPS
jgi:hypothetical protein